MQRQDRVGSAAILGLLLVLGMYIGGAQLKEAVSVWKRADRIVSVKGLSERDVEADLVLWPISYTVSGSALDDLHHALGVSEQKIRTFFVRHGFDEEELTTTPPQVTDRWEHYFGENRPTDRYTAEGVVLLRTDKVAEAKVAMPRVEELVREDVLLSRSYEHRPQFIFTGLNEIKPDMIAEATKEARKAAIQFAEDSGSGVGQIRSAQQGYFTVEDLDDYTPDVKRVRVVTTIEYLLAD